MPFDPASRTGGRGPRPRSRRDKHDFITKTELGQPIGHVREGTAAVLRISETNNGPPAGAPRHENSARQAWASLGVQRREGGDKFCSRVKLEHGSVVWGRAPLARVDA